MRNGMKAFIKSILDPPARTRLPKGSIKQSCNRGRSGELFRDDLKLCVMIKGELPPAELSWRWGLTCVSEPSSIRLNQYPIGDEDANWGVPKLLSPWL